MRPVGGPEDESGTRSTATSRLGARAMTDSRASAPVGIVANGRARCLRSPELWEKREDAIRGVWAEYEEEARSCGPVRRALLWLAARREVKRRVKKLVEERAPQKGLY
jgi:hypothetical protein